MTMHPILHHLSSLFPTGELRTEQDFQVFDTLFTQALWEAHGSAMAEAYASGPASKGVRILLEQAGSPALNLLRMRVDSGMKYHSAG